MNWKPYVTFAAVSLLSHAIGMNAFAAQAGILQQGNTTTMLVPATEAQMGANTIDYVNAKPMDLPGIPARSAAEEQADLINALMSQATMGTPGVSPGARGSGKLSPTFLGVPNAADDAQGLAPQEFGTNNHPFSTARADLFNHATNTAYPYSASGKLFFKIGTDSFVCSASLIKRGLVVTAAHCVANFGKSQFYSGWSFVPGYRNGVAPFQAWSAQQVRVLTSYFNGTDPCQTAGVVCQDDVAVIRLVPKSNPTFPGTSTGWYGYGWNGFGFASTTTRTLTHITQIGYPVCLDNGALMERNDSHGVKTPSMSNNTVIGSLMCGGSSGGPWLVNFGIRPTLTGTTNGTDFSPNIVVGVTSWGYISNAPKEMGASPFLSTNIGVLVNATCGNPVNQPACQ